MKLLKTLPCAAAMLAAAVAAPSAAQAEAVTYYVSPTGSDTAAGTAAAPLRTLTKAFSRAAGGERIVVAAGSYPLAQDTRARTTPVTVVGGGTGTTTVAGLDVLGGQKLRISGMTFTGTVRFAQHPTLFGKQVATDVVLSDSEITKSGVTCVYVRDTSRTITLQRNWIHDCATGVAGPYSPNGLRSSDVVIDHNTIEDMSADGIQFGSWDRVKVTGNTIRDISDPAGVVHNDGVQLTGGSDDVEISRNRIARSRTQLILIQDAMAPVNDVRVLANVLSDAGGVAVQSGAATGLRVVNNTILNARYGGLWLWPGMGPGGTPKIVPTDTVVVNNLLPSFTLKDGAKVATSAGNVTECPTGKLPSGTPTGVACVTAFGLVDPAGEQFALTPSAPERLLGSPLASAGTDIAGTPYGTPVLPGAVA